MPKRFLSLALAVILTVAVAACAGSNDQAVRVDASPSGQPSGGQTQDPADDPGDAKPGPTSIVQLGDSIASGEGTLYGYTYDQATQSWTGGDLNAKWPPPYPECHVSPDAYGNLVAKSFNAKFAQFACTGATFEVGIEGPMTVDGVTRRPAEFGNWATQADLNAEYDAANPDLVLVTLGADDVDFSQIVTDCVKNAYKHYWWNSYKLECVDGNPGDSVQKYFFNVLPTVKKNYATLVDWIEKRAAAHKLPTPKIVFTNYANPLPGPKVTCPDARMLYDDQVQYLAKLLGQMNDLITSTINGLGKKNVAVADISKVYQPPNDDHRWCSNDPWAYGLSIFSFTEPSTFDSKAPFHPTPAGQKAIAAGVLATVTLLFDTPHPVDTTTTSVPVDSTTTSSTEPSTTTTMVVPSTDAPPPTPDTDPGPDPGDGG